MNQRCGLKEINLPHTIKKSLQRQMTTFDKYPSKTFNKKILFLKDFFHLRFLSSQNF